MRIITYSDPFSIKNEKCLWDLMSAHPQFCASDTLVQGMVSYYGRQSFPVIRPLQDLIDVFLGSYTKNAINDMQMFLTITDLIHQWPDSPQKQSFLFNKAEVVQAIQLLTPLKIKVNDIDQSVLDDDQKKLFSLYRDVMNTDCYQVFRNLDRKTIIDFQESVRDSSAREVTYLAQTGLCKKILERLRIDPKVRSRETARHVAAAVIQYYESNPFAATGESAHLLQTKMKCALEGMDRHEDQFYNTIIIHGVHRITPIIYYLVNLLEDRLGVEVIFALHYVDNVPAIYRTWQKVYEWTDKPFENVHSLDLSKAQNDSAVQMANVLAGQRPSELKPGELFAYDNLTAFALHEVGTVFNDTKLAFDDADGRLNSMKIQYYAVKGTECNELLQMFYPKQFNTKPFLSYPIGQFILGLYQMWDFETNDMRFNYNSIIECATSGLFQDDNSLLSTLRKTRLYFEDIETYQEYSARLCLLESLITNDLNEPVYQGLKKLSFFSISWKDLNSLRDFIDSVYQVAQRLFKNESKEQMNYRVHFKKLMDIVSSAIDERSQSLNATEKELIRGIKEQLGVEYNNPVIGNMQDVTDALTFFLASKTDKESSNWIVRDFEQIDGAVLLSEGTVAEKYHFSLLSNEHMLAASSTVLPWPLTEDIFNGKNAMTRGVRAVVAGIKERRNFLRYTLFYGSFFSRRPIEYSFLAEENDEEQTPYYLFETLGYKVVPRVQDVQVGFKSLPKETPVLSAKFSASEEAKELFSVCPFKFLMSSVMKAGITYYSEYHIKYFLSYYMTYVVRARESNLSKRLAKLDQELNWLRKALPFWGDTIFQDLRRDCAEALNKYAYNSENVRRRKENFLVGAWYDQEQNWKMDFNKPNIATLLQEYSMSDKIYPDEQELPRNSICDNCNFSGICLRDFYMKHTEPETDEMEVTS